MSSELVVDASVAVKWFVDEEFSDAADRIAASARPLLAPKLVVLEVANALRRKVDQGIVSQENALLYLRGLPRYFTSLADHEELVEPALSRACELRHPIYDLIYLELARRRAAVLVTADRRLIDVIVGGRVSADVVHLSDWRP